MLPAESAARRRDVIVIGAGLAGSTIAAALAQRGWDVLLVESDQFPRHKVCGEFLSPEAQHSLTQLGLLGDVAELAPVPLYSAAITTGGGKSLSMALPAAAWGLSRYALDAGLAAAAVRCGAEFWPASTVTSVTHTGDGNTVQLRRLRQPLTLRARTVIFACGRHSAAGLPPREAERSTQAEKQSWKHCVGLKRHYTGVVMEPRVELYLFPGGYVGINPVEGSLANVCLLITYAAFQAAGRSMEAVLTAAVKRHPQLAQRLAEAQTVLQSECAVAPVNTERRPTPWDGSTGAPCLGDTASMIPPLAGDGMAMALRSAELCLGPAHAYLCGEMSLDGWADTYGRAWRDEFGTRLRLGRALQWGLTTPLLGDGLAAIGGRFPALAGLMLAGTRGQMT